MKTFFKKSAAFIAGMTTVLGMLSSGIPDVIENISASAAADCVINTSVEHQIIRGFGGINHPEWTGADLSEEQRQTAFGNGENELGFSILRVYVNEDKNQWFRALETAKAAQAQGAYIFASPWKPPAGMQEAYKDSVRLRSDKYAEYAAHLNDFVHYMRDNGVELYCISVQNEPDYAHEWTWWTSDECTEFLANYADVIDCRVMSPETFQYTNKDYYTKILENEKAYANCDLFATHFYGTQRSQMDFPALENSGKEIWMTEVYVPNSEANSNERWPEALQVAENIHNGLVVGNMSAYVWWYIRRNYGPMNEDGTISKRGYMMAQYSKFVRPEYVRIDATEQPETGIMVSAYKDDGEVVIVAINSGTSDVVQEFSFANETVSEVDRWRSSAYENLAYTGTMELTGDGFFASLPAQSVTTFVASVSVEADENGYYFHDTFEDGVSDWTGHGGTDVSLSGRSPYQGTEALIVQNRTGSWNGAEKPLNSSAFVPGNEYSFSVCAAYLDGENTTENFKLTLQYTDSSGKTKFSNIASGTAAKGSYVQLANTNYMIPEDASDMRIYVETESGTNNFYIDEAIGAVEGTSIEGPEGIDHIIGDVNADGKFTIADAVMLQKWLLGSGEISNAKAGDVSEDGKLNIFDLSVMKKMLLNKKDVISPEVYMTSVGANILESEPSDAVIEAGSVQYGTFEKVTYTSEICGGRQKGMNVLLPAGYSEDKQYPVLYALHGYWGNEDSLLDAGDSSLKLRQIIGNAIAKGEAEEMIVVFPDIYASATQDACDGMNAANNAAYDNFINVLINEIMPYIERNYSIKTGRENTAITGFSMGGRESLYIGFSRPDLFGYVGAMCPAPGLDTDLISADSLKFIDIEPYLLMLSAGSDDQVVWSTPAGYHDIFNSNKVTHIWHYVNGGDHGGKSIRPHMYNFVRAVFKAE